jgi:hypothetical protein
MFSMSASPSGAETQRLLAQSFVISSSGAFSGTAGVGDRVIPDRAYLFMWQGVSGSGGFAMRRVIAVSSSIWPAP